MSEEACLPDSSGADWFRCALGTTSCPRIHNGITPHCIACTAGEPCRFGHDPPALAQTEEEYRKRAIGGAT